MVAAARREDRLQVLKEELAKEQHEITVRRADASNPEDMQQLARETLQNFGRVDILVFASGINTRERAMNRLTPEVWNSLVAVNLNGAFYATHAVLPSMRSARSGHLIYISSISGVITDVSGAVYQASKRGVLGMAHAIRMEEKQNGIRTSVICPGLVDTELLEQRPVSGPRSSGTGLAARGRCRNDPACREIAATGCYTRAAPDANLPVAGDRINRRSFMALSATAAVAASLSGELFADAHQGGNLPWHQKIRRVGQLNITEHDPAVLNVEEWGDYWASLKCDVVFASVTGIVAYLSDRRCRSTGESISERTRPHGRTGGGREEAQHARDRALQPRPQLGRRAGGASGVVQARQGGQTQSRHSEDNRSYKTCIFTSYMTEHMPALMREVNSRYAGRRSLHQCMAAAWPAPECYCDACKDLPHFDTPAYWEKYTERVVYLWKMWDAIAKEKSPDNLFFGNMGGAIQGGPNMKALKGVAEWYNCDNQGRGGIGRANLGLHAAGQSVQRHSGWAHRDQCDGLVFDRHSALEKYS